MYSRSIFGAQQTRSHGGNGAEVHSRRALRGNHGKNSTRQKNLSIELAREFSDVFPETILAVIPTYRGVRHEIDLA